MPVLKKRPVKKAVHKKPANKKPMRRRAEPELFTGQAGEHFFNFKHNKPTRTRQETYVNVKPILGYAVYQYIQGRGGPKYARDMHRRSGDYNKTTHVIHRGGQTRRKADFEALGDFINKKSNGKFILVSGKIFVVVRGNKTVKRTSVLTKAEFDELQAILKDNYFQKRTRADARKKK